MKILIPPSEGKAKVQPLDILFKDTNFKFAEYTQQIVDYLGLIEYEDLTSVYGTSQEKSEIFALCDWSGNMLNIQETFSHALINLID